jgi:hypothetical protein
MIVYTQFSNSGRILKLFNQETDQLIAEILIHGFLSRAALMSSLAGNGSYVYRGECFQLAAYEYLDTQSEIITERENS